MGQDRQHGNGHDPDALVPLHDHPEVTAAVQAAGHRTAPRPARESLPGGGHGTAAFTVGQQRAREIRLPAVRPGRGTAVHEPTVRLHHDQGHASGADDQAGGTGPPRASAADVREERMLRPRSAAPQRGWRRTVYRLSAGLVNPGPSAAELRARDRGATINTPVPGSRTIAVVSTKGGVGKTTSTVNLGHTFATYRGDRIVALDGNPDAGSLGYRVRRETSATAEDLLAQADAITRYGDLRAFTSQAGSRLEVIASPHDPSVSRALGEAEYQRLVALLEHHYTLILVDCGTGILDSATRGIVDVADQLVVVTGPSVDSGRATSYLLDWLESHGLGALVAGAVTVVNAVPRRGGLVDVDRLEANFAQRCRAVVRIPWDRHLAAGAHTSLGECAGATRDAYLRLAAAVAEGFTAPARGQVRR